MSECTGTIYVIDDDALVRDGLKRLLAPVGYRVHTLESLDAFTFPRCSDAAACLVVDVFMPDTGIRLATLGDLLPVIFTAQHADVSTCVRAIKAGAVDFLEKPLRDQEVLDAVHQGIVRSRAFHLTEIRKTEIKNRFAALRAREREVLQHVVRGRLSKQIAVDLGLSLNTVKKYRSRAMRQIQVETLAELIRTVDGLSDPALSHSASNSGVSTAQMILAL